MLQTKNSGLALDVKSVSDDGTFEGYGSVFGVVDSYNEVVEPGAFSGSLVDGRRKGRSVKMLWQHNTDQPIGVWSDLAEDSKGLYVKGTLLKDVSSQAAEAYGLLKAGALDGLSIGYREIETAPHPDKQGVLSLKKLDLREISVVTFAANEKARVDTIKSIIQGGALPTLPDFEDFLREAGGFSRSQAKAIAAHGLKHLSNQREAGREVDDQTAFLSALLNPAA